MEIPELFLDSGKSFVFYYKIKEKPLPPDQGSKGEFELYFSALYILGIAIPFWAWDQQLVVLQER